MKRIELGVFLPVARNGFLMSTVATAYRPTYQEQLEITLRAESLGFDFVFSMLKWRGLGGKSQYWDSSLDSFTLMTALAAVTSQIELIATVNPLLIHPTPMSKMSATVDEISHGRLGLNVITGAFQIEYTQMGLVPVDYEANRYAYASEWVQVLKRLWSEPSVSHKGEYFHLTDCVSEPKPKRNPRPFLVCAGGSDEGMTFTVRETDIGYVSGNGFEAKRDVVRKLRAVAERERVSTKAAIPALVVLDDTHAEAVAHWKYLESGADVEGAKSLGQRQVETGRERQTKLGSELLAGKRRISGSEPILGSPEEVAEQIIRLALEADIDSFALIFDDYMAGLEKFGAEVMPILRDALDIGPR